MSHSDDQDIDVANLTHIPPGERKSGMPEATETPAPVKMQTDVHSGERMRRAIPASPSFGKSMMFDDV